MAVDKHHIDYSLYLVTDRGIIGARDLVYCIASALAGGVTIVQLREKNASGREFYNTAVQVKQLCERFGVPLIINDRLDIMQAVDADGLHIGQQDIPLEVACRIIGPSKILGYSVSTWEQALLGQLYADYLGAGPVFPTDSKSDASDPIGIEGLRVIRSSVRLPVVAIGGINPSNLTQVKETGVDGIAVISAILGHEDIQGAARHMIDIWRER